MKDLRLWNDLSLVICILLPIVILLVGIIFSMVYALQTIPEAFGDDSRGLVPAKFSVTLENPQRYSVWVYSKGMFEGEEYRSVDEALPPGAKILIMDKKSGENLSINDWMNGTKSTMSEEAFLLGQKESPAYPTIN